MFEFGEQDETPFIVMEFLRGWSLAEPAAAATPPMPLREKLDIAIQLCAGLEAAHKQGVVHRDVKPGNVWICLDGTVKLLDFGIATGGSSNATVVDVLGTPGYMSPGTDRRHAESTRGPTSSRPAWCSTRCSPAGGRSRRIRPPA